MEKPSKFWHIEKTAGKADLPAHKFPMLVDPSLLPSRDAILLIEDYLPKAFPNITGEVYCPQCLQYKKLFFFNGSLQRAFWLFLHFRHEHFV